MKEENIHFAKPNRKSKRKSTVPEAGKMAYRHYIFLESVAQKRTQIPESTPASKILYFSKVL